MISIYIYGCTTRIVQVKNSSGYSSFSALAHLLNKYTSCSHDGGRSYTTAISKVSIHLLKFPYSCTIFMYMLYFCSCIAGYHEEYKYCTLEQQIFYPLSLPTGTWVLQQSCSKGWEWYTGQQYAMSLTGHMTRKRNNAVCFALCLIL